MFIKYYTIFYKNTNMAYSKYTKTVYNNKK